MKNIHIKKRVLILVTLSLTTLLGFSQSNQYLHFDGVDDYVSLPNGAQFVNGNNTISMAGWFYSDVLGYGQGMMSIRGGGTGSGEMYLIQLGNGKLQCRLVTTTGLHQVTTAEGIIQAGQWQHFAWVFNQNTVEIFLNGVSIGSSTASGTFSSTNRPFTIGKCILAGYNFLLQGRSDEVSLWSKALTQSEIQNMMNNELNGDEANLELYYKFNQGTPDGNNSGISQLLDFSNTANKNADLNNFALTGSTSNFSGILDSNFQAIDFPLVGTKITTDDPFSLQATVNSNLPISYEIISGPATVNGNIVTLTGLAGEVTVKASQSGDENYLPAPDVFVTFPVVDPNLNLAQTETLHPLAGTAYASSLTPIQIAFKVGIEYTDVFSIESVSASVDGENVELTNYGNGHYTGWWTPTSWGSHNLVVTSTNNFGAAGNQTTTFNLNQNATTQTVLATDDVWVYADVPSVTVETDLPSYTGAFNQITATLFIDCPNGGCDPWDRVSSIEVLGKDGEWYNIIRYITPYGVSCQHQIDLTDFMSLLSGRTKFRVNLGTTGNGFLYTLQLNYQAGTPNYPYSTVKKLWNQTYQFGDMANLQPTEDFNLTFSEGTQTAKIKLVSTGHGWGAMNTSNAAEFSNNTHHIWVNGQQTFTQNNWVICNPNPDNCSPQAGTWQYNRAGWCPGTIAQYFDFDMTAFINSNSIDLDYVFDESYNDYCHPNNPDCITGVTCDNCNEGFNPHLIVNSYLISYANLPAENNLSIEEHIGFSNNMHLYPNPSGGKFFVDFQPQSKVDNIEIHDLLGRHIMSKAVYQGESSIQMDLSGKAGVYLVSLKNGSKVIQTKRLVIE
ncbi:LamG-like jellyroll fold domain-containing protein [Mangrovimonas aestuarii]|uniref:LamG-like jellyroll fold domain-containing protein n=1 Tax=Mangrovimonas aestuarii TaxID=3018443 RepID=UPI0023794C89|nr:LamG-like jellyroll fold domain-containing protein [Mangrovimonas aestuarii]